MVDVPAILIISFLVILIIIILIGIAMVYGKYNQCRNNESSYCYQITCPNPDPNNKNPNPPCGNYARRPGPREGTWFCSSAPETLVDNNGNIVKQ